ncbi:MAG: 4Fe-4S dicluster domain-containing protein [Bacteroidales bacterium]|nr:4Fe-4S dicluster domain-containing protein [Bacteroidales bacterium]MBQ9639906.1 4Fe-4S dicluster domain-containing protein [Bacteroidales bacterium]
MGKAADGYELFLSRARQHAEKSSSRSVEQLCGSQCAEECNKELGSYLAGVHASVLTRLDEVLKQFEKSFTSPRTVIKWCSDYQDVFLQLRTLVSEVGYRSVCFPQYDLVENSPFDRGLFCELGLRYFINDEGLSISDAGDMQLFLADAVFADQGTMLLRSMSPHALELYNNTHIKIVFATISSVYEVEQDAEVFEAVKCACEQTTEGMTLLSKSAMAGVTYLFLVDNGRSKMLPLSEGRNVLSCIECRRCEEVCPVAQLAGADAYNNVFTGPVGSVVLPYMENVVEYGYAPFACTMCGVCEEVCPMQLRLRDMIVESRSTLASNRQLDVQTQEYMRTIQRLFLDRKHQNRHLRWKRLLSFFNTKHHNGLAKYYHLPSSTFNTQACKKVQ